MTESRREELFTFIQEHHFGVSETLLSKCPPCNREIVVELKALELDPGTIEVYWGKSPEEIEDKRSKAEKELKRSDPLSNCQRIME